MYINIHIVGPIYFYPLLYPAELLCYNVGLVWIVFIEKSIHFSRWLETASVNKKERYVCKYFQHGQFKLDSQLNIISINRHSMHFFLHLFFFNTFCFSISIRLAKSTWCNHTTHLSYLVHLITMICTILIIVIIFWLPWILAVICQYL